MKNSQQVRAAFNITIFLLIATLVVGCKSNEDNDKAAKDKIANTLDSFNKAAANADFNAYFNYFTEDAIFDGDRKSTRLNSSH